MNGAYDVKLNYSEIVMATVGGILRMADNILHNRKHTYGNTDENDNWESHCEGAMAEVAVAKLLNIYWTSNAGIMRTADLGDIEVRWTYSHDRRLILHPEDKDGSMFVSVVGRHAKYTVRGWVYGHEGKRPEYWENPTNIPGRDAFFVPNNVLRSMEEFKEIRHRRQFENIVGWYPQFIEGERLPC